MNTILEEKLKFLIDKSKEQYRISKGYHLNSNDWKTEINVNKPNLYSFIVNGIIKFNTLSKHNNKEYTQIIKLMAYKEIESSIFILLLLNVPESLIITFFKKFFMITEAKVHCNCEAEKYWGYTYILTKMKSSYGSGENRYPKDRNPNLEGIVCKHMWQVFMELEKYIETLGSELIPFYKRMFGMTTNDDSQKIYKKIKRDGLISILTKSNKNLKRIKDGGNLFNFYNKIIEQPMKTFDLNELNNENTKINDTITKDNNNDIEPKDVKIDENINDDIIPDLDQKKLNNDDNEEEDIVKDLGESL